MARKEGDGCRRLTAALADGRFVENPGPWLDHLATCDSCRHRVEGLSALRELIGAADRISPPEPAGPGRARQAIEAAFLQYDRDRRRRRITTGGVGVLLLVCVGGMLLFGSNAEPDPSKDPVAYARLLHDRVYPGGGESRFDLLKNDATLRAEYVRALDHPESVVRRTALGMLLRCGVALDPAHLEDVLSRADETLERPLEVAGQGDAVRWLHDALAARRIATLQSTLVGLGVLAANGHPTVQSTSIERFLAHGDAQVRAAALSALHQHDGYVAGDVVARVLRSEPDEGVRRYAASLLASRGGDAGRETVFEYLRSRDDFAVEDSVLAVLGEGDDAFAFHEERLATSTVRPRTALWHLYRLVRADRLDEPPEALIERALAAEDPTAPWVLGLVARKADWNRYRTPLQRRWRELSRGGADRLRTHLGVNLMKWDLDSGDLERAVLALEIAETDRAERMRPLVERLAESEDPTVRERATTLLAEWTNDS